MNPVNTTMSPPLLHEDRQFNFTKGESVPATDEGIPVAFRPTQCIKIDTDDGPTNSPVEGRNSPIEVPSQSNVSPSLPSSRLVFVQPHQIEPPSSSHLTLSRTTSTRVPARTHSKMSAISTIHVSRMRSARTATQTTFASNVRVPLLAISK